MTRYHGGDTGAGHMTATEITEMTRNEKEQIRIRLFLLIVISCWIFVKRSLISGYSPAPLLTLATFYLIANILVYLSIIVTPGNTKRLYFAVFVDSFAISWAIWLDETRFSPFFFVIFLTIIGNLLRYGGKVMTLSSISSIFFYGGVLSLYFITGQPNGPVVYELEVGKILSLIVIPQYLTKIVHRLREKKESEAIIMNGIKEYQMGKDALNFGYISDPETRNMAEQLEILSLKAKESHDWMSSQTETLQNMVDVRTAQLSREIERAQESEKLKTQFLNNLSHELKTPLHSIIGFSELLVQNRLSQEERSKIAGFVNRNAQNLLKMIEDLTELTTLLSGQAVLSTGPVNMAELAREIVSGHRKVAGEKSITINIGVKGEISRLIMDGKVAQKIVTELLDNAIKFTPKQGEIYLDLEQEPGKLKITVTDTGEGIGPDYRDAIFKLFRQAEGGLNRRFEGLGIGLSLVKLLTDLHKGSVMLNDDRAKTGASFTVTLPVDVI